MARKRPRRYFWALHFAPDDPEVLDLSPAGREGLDYATKFAKHARERSRSALEPGGWESLPPLTDQELARRECVNVIDLRSKVKQARIELFGRDLSDSAIAYRLRKRRQHRGGRTCADPDCQEEIPALAHSSRRYCPMHASGAARVRRHRYGAAGPPRRPRPATTAQAQQQRDDRLERLSPEKRERLDRFYARLMAGEFDDRGSGRRSA